MKLRMHIIIPLHPPLAELYHMTQLVAVKLTSTHVTAKAMIKVLHGHYTKTHILSVFV